MHDEDIFAVEDVFEAQDESFYTTGIQALQHRWEKCVDRRGDYVNNTTKYMLHLVKFDHCTIVSLWTFRPTRVTHGAWH